MVVLTKYFSDSLTICQYHKLETTRVYKIVMSHADVPIAFCHQSKANKHANLYFNWTFIPKIFLRKGIRTGKLLGTITSRSAYIRALYSNMLQDCNENLRVIKTVSIRNQTINKLMWSDKMPDKRSHALLQYGCWRSCLTLPAPSNGFDKVGSERMREPRTNGR